MMKNNMLLTVGDVVEADASWHIAGLSEDGRRVDINQGSVSGDDLQDLACRVEEAEINLDNTKFIVVEVNPSATGYLYSASEYCPIGHYVKLQALDENNRHDPDGLCAQFYQSGAFTIMVKEPKVVGRMEPAFLEFKPIAP